jgi:hypothetical protein
MEYIERDLPWSRKVHSRVFKRFRIEDCRPMATPMVTNLKKVSNSYLELVDPRIYR